MPRITLQPVDRGPPQSPTAVFAKLAGMFVSTIASAGLVYLLLTFSWEGERKDWDWQPEDIRSNFAPLYTTKEIQDRFRQKRAEWDAQNPIAPFPGSNDAGAVNRPPSNEVRVPFANDPEVPLPPDYKPSGGVNQLEVDRLRAEHELKLTDALKLAPVFKLLDETQSFIEPVVFEDAAREKCMNEFTAYQGRQAPVNEQLAIQVLRKLPAPGSADHTAYLAKVDKAGWFYGKSQQAADIYRGLGFSVEGRLYDLYEIKPEQPIVLQDGSKITAYFEGVVALLGPGLGRGEARIEQRTVMFQSFTLPDALKPYLNDRGSVAHDDKLATEPVMVKLTGPYLRRWVYSREVSPFSSEAKKVLTQDHLPMLLTADLALSDMDAYELTDELLQQVRDSIREDPAYLESEAAYYAMLAKANAPDDAIEVVPEIGYFDLAGEETGPRYRGQGLRVVGMVGENYAPVILPPNISGLRRVFRILVVGDTADMKSPKRYLVDMIEPPSNLEPLAIIDMEARYYRNVFETESTSSTVRPLLIVRRIKGFGDQKRGDGWIFGAVGGAAVIVMLGLMTWFVLSERRERARFEAGTLEQSRKRLEKRGGLKLKPLPGKGEAPPPPPAPDKPPDKE